METKIEALDFPSLVFDLSAPQMHCSAFCTLLASVCLKGGARQRATLENLDVRGDDYWKRLAPANDLSASLPSSAATTFYSSDMEVVDPIHVMHSPWDVRHPLPPSHYDYNALFSTPLSSPLYCQMRELGKDNILPQILTVITTFLVDSTIWCLSLSKLQRCLPVQGDCPGITSPFSYLATAGATFAWHVEDASLGALNISLGGAFPIDM